MDTLPKNGELANWLKIKAIDVIWLEYTGCIIPIFTNYIDWCNP